MPFGRHTRFELSNPASGNRFSIVPGKGANVLNLFFGGKNILDGYDTPEELEVAKFGKSVLLFPFPNRMDRGLFHWEGKPHQFPINNAATENAIHGFVREEAFHVTKIELTNTRGSIHCQYQYAGDRPYYPFPFVLDLVFSIRDAGEFSVKATCTNLHDRHIPFGFGWHPYFRLTEKADDHALHLPPCAQIEINERMIPTGVKTEYAAFEKKKHVRETFLDNCFEALIPGNYSLVLRDGNHSIRVKANTSQFPFFQVFTPPHRSSIALEPMTCNVDAFNNGDGLIILEPKAKWTGAMLVSYK